MNDPMEVSNFDYSYRPMDTDMSAVNRLTQAILACAFRVINTLGAGFNEKIYENALAIELRKAGIAFAQQHRIRVYYDDLVIGDYTTDLLVENLVLVEMKAVKALDSAHAGQCINYLKATGLRICLLLNFGRPRLEIQRLIHGG